MRSLVFPRPHLIAAALGLAAIATVAAPRSAGAFQISPIIQDFAPSGRDATQTFQVLNEHDEQVTVQVSIQTREVDVDGREAMKPTGAFSVFPTELVVPPHGTQIVRAKWIGDAAPKSELAYRLVAEEVPVVPRRDTPGASITMTVRYVGSLYVVPKGVSPSVKVVSAQPAPGPNGKAGIELLVENQGTAHTILDNPSVEVTSGGVTKRMSGAMLDGNLPQENVLAQHQRRFWVLWPEGLPQGNPLQAKLTFNPQR